MMDLSKYLPCVIYECVVYPDNKRKFSYISEACEAILGVGSDDVLKDHSVFESIIHEDDRIGFSDISPREVARNSDWHWQGRIHYQNEIRWIEIRASVEPQANGIHICRGIIQNITERKRAERESEVKYQSLVEKLPIGIVIHQKGRLVYANSQAYAIFGVKNPKGLIGGNVLDYVAPEYREKIRERMQEAEAGVPVPMMEQKFLRTDGRLIDVETMAFPFSLNGERSVQVIFRDISEKKAAEARIKKNETLFTQLFQNVPMAVVMLDEFGKVTQVNRGFEQMFGFERGELRGKNLNDFIVPDELRNEGIDLNNLITANQVVSIETIRRHRSGELVNVILCGVPVMLENQTIGIYGVYIDITDRKHVEQELKIRNTELDNFVYKVSHDLRAPLSSILGLVNLSRLPGNTDNPRDYIDIIGQKVQALDHFIGDVLSHSKNLKMEVNINRVNLQEIIDQTFRELGYLEGASDIRRFVKIEGIDFFSDHWRVSEIFRNLISNAIKYRQLGVESSEIQIKIDIDHLRADISFADNGIGIEEQSLSRIFEMFYRATEQSDGSGIGLYIVKNAVDKLGGQINVASRPGQGTRFNILLPNRINSIINRKSTVEIEQ